MDPQKTAIRKAIKEAKAAVSFLKKAERSEAVVRRVMQDERFHSAKNILMYWSLPDEVYTHSLAEQWQSSKRVLLPCVEGDDLVLRQYTGLDSLRKGPFGIDEPVGEVFDRYDEIEIAVIPGIAFDRHRNRLGRGRGFYDRLLPLLPHAYKIGVGFDFQIVDSVPTEPHDMPMDAVYGETIAIR